MKMIFALLLAMAEPTIPPETIELARRMSAFNAAELKRDDPAINDIPKHAPGYSWREVPHGQATRIRLGHVRYSCMVYNSGGWRVTGMRDEHVMYASQDHTAANLPDRIRYREEGYDIACRFIYALGIVRSLDDLYWVDPSTPSEDLAAPRYRPRGVRVGIQLNGFKLNVDFPVEINYKVGAVDNITLMGPPKVPYDRDWRAIEQELLDQSIFDFYMSQKPFNHAVILEGRYLYDGWIVGLQSLSEQAKRDMAEYRMLPTYRRVFRKVEETEITSLSQVLIADARDGAVVGFLEYEDDMFGGHLAHASLKTVTRPDWPQENVTWRVQGRSLVAPALPVSAPHEFTSDGLVILEVGNQIFRGEMNMDQRTVRIPLPSGPVWLRLPYELMGSGR